MGLIYPTDLTKNREKVTDQLTNATEKIDFVTFLMKQKLCTETCLIFLRVALYYKELKPSID